MTTLFYRYPRLLILSLLLIGIGGISSFYIMPRLEDPEISQTYSAIKIRLPGADANRVETLITEKVENKLAEVEEIKLIFSFTSPELSDIRVELKDNVKNVDQIWSKIRDKIDNVLVELPPQASKPEFEPIETQAHALIIAFTWETETPNHSILRRRAKELTNQLNGIFGTEKIKVFGEQQEEIQIILTSNALNNLNLSIEQIATQIRNSDPKISSGTLRTGSNVLLMETQSKLDSLERIGKIAIKLEDSGQIVRLSEVAKIHKTIQTPSSFSLVDGKFAVVLGLNTISSQRMDLWLSQVEKIITNYQKGLPSEIKLAVLFNQNKYTLKRIEKLQENLLLGLLLVIVVIFSLMDWKSALTISLTLPLASLMVLSGMRFFDVPIHQISVTGLVISLGLLVDNAIVIVDELQNQLIEKGLAPQKALANSIEHLFIPLIGSTLTTTFSFMPIVLAPGPIGEFINAIGISVILSLFSSLFLSLTIVPTIHILFYVALKKLSKKKKISQRNLLHRTYFKILKFFFSNPLLAILISMVFPLLGFMKAADLKDQFFPPSDRDQIQIEFELPIISSLEETKTLVLEANTLLKDFPKIANVHWFLGQSAPLFYYNLPRGKEHLPYYAQSLIQLKSHQGSIKLVRSLQKTLDEKFPQVKVLVRLLEQGPLVDAPIELRIYGPDHEILQYWGEQIRREFSKIPNVIHSRESLNEVVPKIEFVLNEDKVRLAGLDYATISNQLAGMIEGENAGSILETTEDIPVKVLLTPKEKDKAFKISSLYLISPQNENQLIPLNSLGTTKLFPSSANIFRRNRERTNTVNIFIKAGVLASEVQNEFKKRWNNKKLPPGYRYEFGGESEGKGEAVGNLVSAVGILLFLMIATLVLSVQSFIIAGLIIIIAICSVGLGLGALWLFDIPFGFMAILGSMGLIGIAVNDALVVMAGIKRESQNQSEPLEYVCEAVFTSSRHVIATSITTMAGFIPIIIAQESFWLPMVIPISGGIFGATILALLFLPASYLILEKLNQKIKNATNKK